MVSLAACAAMADDKPQPEGGKKFESVWAIPGGLVDIEYEEEGYRITLDILKKDDTGTEWEYSCFYHEETDSLKSVSSCRTDYTYDPVTNGKEFADPVYDGDDNEKTVTEFTIDKDGFLIWKDSREDAGAGLKFTNVGQFEGVWKNDAEGVRLEARWNDDKENEMTYSVFITIGKTDGDRYAEYTMRGTYDSQTGKFTAKGTRVVYTKNAKGEYDTEEDQETYEAVFTRTEDGKVCFETENSVLLEFCDNWVG